MNQPVTNEACESRRCEMRKLIKDEIRDVMASFTDNRIVVNDWLVRLEKKIDDNNISLLNKMDENNRRISDKMDDINKLMVILILAVALGAIGLRLGWI